MISISIICRDDDHAGWVCRTKKMGFRRIPDHLLHYDGMTLTERIYRIIYRIAKKYQYILPEEFQKLLSDLKFKYTRGHISGDWKEQFLSDYGYAGEYDGWFFPETIQRKEFLEIIEKMKIIKELDMKTTGDLRAALAKCFIEAMEGRLSGDALRGVIGCANQINTSLAVEIKARAQLTREGAATGAMGEMYLNKQEKKQ